MPNDTPQDAARILRRAIENALRSGATVEQIAVTLAEGGFCTLAEARALATEIREQLP